MKEIPEISFKRRGTKQIEGFELVVLEELSLSLQNLRVDHNPFRPHRLGFFAILIITEGEVKHKVDFREHHLIAGDVMVISKGQIHAFNQNSDYVGFLVLFTEGFMQKYIAASTIVQINHLYNYFLKQEKITNPDTNETLLRVLNNELKNDLSSLPNIIGALLSIYLLKLSDENNSKISSNRYLHYFNHFKLLVEKNFSKTRDAKAYAADLSISYRSLNDICKEITKNTAKSFIDSYVVLESKRLLVTTTLSIKEIAYNIGFDEVTNFTKFFKKHTSETPSQFHKRMNQ